MENLNSEAEQKRLDSLKSFQILDTLPEQEFDDLTLLASHICETPIATISLIDENRQWFKSRVGLSATETSRDLAFCNHTIQGDDLFIVPNATENADFAENPLVTKDPHIRFYAGAPLITSEGQNIGALCVIDRKPRELSVDQKRALTALSRSAVNLMENRRKLLDLKNEIAGDFDFSIEDEKTENEKTIAAKARKSAEETTFFQKYVKHYLVATLVVIITTVVKWLIESATQIESPYLLFACAVLLSAWRGGFGPGLYATLLTACVIDYFFISPIGLFFDRGFGQNLRLLIFIAQGVFITMLCASRLRNENLLHYARTQLENRVAKRTNQLAQANKILHKEINERAVLQEDLRQARDAALETARLKSDFLANMSHEIRTPMNGVIGVTGLLLDTKLDKEQQRYAEIIRNSGESLLTVINDILDFSKVEAGKLELETLDFNLRNCIESTVELLTSKAQSQKNELATLIYNDVPLYLRGDAGRIQQILTNLIGNAVKFTKDGDIVVRVKKISETVSSVKLRFSVADTGEGISREVQEKLFQPFTQSDASTTRRFGGTGLGLSICRRLVEMMNGEIGVESELGKGSTFWFDISLKKQQSPTIAVQDNPKNFVSQTALKDKRVLVVDDNSVNREVLVYQMRSWNMETEEAANGFEAVERFKNDAESKEPIDLVILDLHMPALNGMETAQRIKAENENVAVIMLSSSVIKIDPKTLNEFGIKASLTKPYRQTDLLDTIYESLNLNRRKIKRVGETHKSVTLASEIEEQNFLKNKHKRILLVEDNQVNQMVAQTMLKKFGYQTDAAGNGLEAIKALELLPYDLVLMDCQMPEMDGYEATRTIRARHWSAAKIPIIALTAHAIEGERDKCLNAGMDDYISKPVQKEILKATLEKWLDVTAEIEEIAPNADVVEVSAAKNIETISAEFAEKSAAIEFAPVDLDTLNDITGNDLEMRREVVEMYLQQTMTQLDEIERAIYSDDAKTLSAVAHKSVGGSAMCGMTALVEPMRKLERLGLDGKIEGAEPILLQARQAFVSINEQCREIIGK